MTPDPINFLAPVYDHEENDNTAEETDRKAAGRRAAEMDVNVTRLTNDEAGSVLTFPQHHVLTSRKCSSTAGGEVWEERKLQHFVMVIENRHATLTVSKARERTQMFRTFTAGRIKISFC